MGWQDRDYSRSKYDSEGFGRRVLRWLSSSVALGTIFGIHVRVHMTLILLIATNLLFANMRGGMGLQNAVTSSVILFGVVLLHEFGHCVAARYVGGDANEILLWPLGGLAFIRTPQRPWPSFVGTAGGPLVNVAICLVTGFALLAMNGFRAGLSFNPLLAFGTGDMISSDSMYMLIDSSNVGYYLWWIYSVSLSLLFFNLLPIYPLDGGRILQTILWPRFGFYDSMKFACTTGMIASGFMGLIGIVTGQFFLTFLAIIGYTTCYQTKMTLREQADAAYEDSRYDASMYRTPKAKRQKRNRRDDDFSIRDLNPFKKIARARRKKQFERLMREDEEESNSK